MNAKGGNDKGVYQDSTLSESGLRVMPSRRTVVEVIAESPRMFRPEEVLN